MTAIRESRQRAVRRKRKRNLAISIVLLLLVIIGICALLITRVYTVGTLDITGNEFYTDAQIEEQLLTDDLSFSTIYVYFKYKFMGNKLNIPFIDSVEVNFDPKDTHNLKVRVYEKGILGYVYIDAIDQNAYFDKDGFVVETSKREIEGVPRVYGLNPEKVVLYEKLDISDETSLLDLLELTQLLEKYSIETKNIHFDSASKKITVKYDKIQIEVGTASYLSQKIMRLQYILPKLKGKKGTLHLDNWTPETTDIVFDPKK